MTEPAGRTSTRWRKAVTTKAYIVLNRHYEAPASDPMAICISVVHPTKPLRKIDIYMTVEQLGSLFTHGARTECLFECDPIGEWKNEENTANA